MVRIFGNKSFEDIELKLRLFLLAIALLVPSVSSAARPLVTDDSGTVGKGKVQVEFGVEWFSWRDTAEGVRIRETGTEASGVITYGILEDLDVVAGFPYAWGRVRENGETVFNANRFSDVSLEAKWRFFERGGFGLALKPGLTLPTGNCEKGFGSGRATYGLTFIASKEMEPFGFHFNGGYARNENRVDEQKDLWSASLAATYNVLEGLSLVGNVGFERSLDPTAGTAPAFGLIGLNYSLNDLITLDTGFKFGLNKQEVDRSVTVGVTLSF